MQKATFFLFCLACESYGRELPSSMYMKQAEDARESIEPSDTLAKFLLGFKPSLSRKSSSVHAHRRTSPQMLEADEQMLSRRAMIAGSVGSVLGAVSSPALAYRVAFPDIAREKIVFDKELLAKKEVQEAMADIIGDFLLLQKLREDFEQDTNVNLTSTLDKYLNLGRVRSHFNKVTPIYDEEAQATTDKKQRLALNSLVTLESAVRIEKGKEIRAKKRIQLIKQEFGGALTAFSQVLAYLPVPEKDYKDYTLDKLTFNGFTFEYGKVAEEPPKKDEEPPKEEPPQKE